MMGSKKCAACGKSIYNMDPQLSLGGKHYHKQCARCATCNGYLSIKNFSTSGDRLLCKTHFKEEFSQGGGVYAGDDKFKMAGSRSRSSSPNPPNTALRGGRRPENQPPTAAGGGAEEAVVEAS